MYKKFILILAFILTACNGSGSSSPSEAEQLQTFVEQNKNYFLYEIEQSIKAIDPDNPTNPITIEPSNSTIAGITSARRYTKFSNNPEKHFFIEDVLIYAKDGRFWKIDNLSSGSFSPTQFSSEDNAFNVCSAFSTPHINIDDSYYLYSFAGPDTFCNYSSFFQDSTNNGVWLPIVTDNIYKWIPIGSDSTTPPFAGAQQFSANNITITSIVFAQPNEQTKGNDIIGVLALDDSRDLVWFEGDDFSTPAFTVATNVTTFKPFSYKNDDTNYIIIEDNLYRYIAGSNSLGNSIFQFSSTNPNLFQNIYNPPINYIVDGQKLYTLDITTDTLPVILTENLGISSTIEFLFESDNYLFIYTPSTPGNILVFSIDKNNGSVNELFTVPGSSRFTFGPKVLVINEYVYYSDDTVPTTAILSPGGEVNETFPGYKIVGTISDPILSTDYAAPAYLILAQHKNDNMVDLFLLNTKNNSIDIKLGQAHENIIQAGLNMLKYGNQIVFQAYGENSLEIFFADVAKENSFTQLTDNTVNEIPISIWWSQQFIP